jgi:hypothetical protein
MEKKEKLLVKKILIGLLTLLAGLTVYPFPPELSAEQILLIKIADVRDWVMEQHLDRGENMWDERDDTFPGLGLALDTGVIDKSVWWGDKEHIERSSLAEKKVTFLEGRMVELYPERGEVKVRGCEPPSKETAWNICTVGLEGLKEGADLFFEISGGYKPYEQHLFYAGIRNPSGEIERISVRREAARDDRGKVAFLVTQAEFSFHLARNDAKDWLERMVPLEYGIGLLVIERDKNNDRDTDKCLLKVHLDRVELEKRKIKSIEVVLGWRDKPIRDFPSFNIWGGDKGVFGGGVAK